MGAMGVRGLTKTVIGAEVCRTVDIGDEVGRGSILVVDGYGQSKSSLLELKQHLSSHICTSCLYSYYWFCTSCRLTWFMVSSLVVRS